MAAGGTDAHHEAVLRVEAATNLASHALLGHLDQAVALLGVVALLKAAQRYFRGDRA